MRAWGELLSACGTMQKGAVRNASNCQAQSLLGILSCGKSLAMVELRGWLRGSQDAGPMGFASAAEMRGSVCAQRAHDRRHSQ